MKFSIPSEAIFISVVLLMAVNSVEAIFGQVNNIGGKLCMGMPSETPPKRKTWRVQKCLANHKVIGTQKGWLRSTFGIFCAYLDWYVGDRILYYRRCDGGSFPAWEWKEPTGARLKKGHGIEIAIKDGPKANQTVELLCPFPAGGEGEDWIIRLCPGEESPCAQDECLRAGKNREGFCGKGPDFCNARSAYLV